MIKIGHWIPCYRRMVRAEIIQSVLIEQKWCADNGYDYEFWFTDGHAIDRGRNEAVRDAIAKGCDYLFMNDDDNWCPDGALHWLMETIKSRSRAAAVGGCYMSSGGKGYVFQLDGKIPAKTVFEVKGVGTGIFLIDLKRLPKEQPYFRYVLQPDGCWPEETEDYYFCRKLKEDGHKVYVDCRFTTGHAKGQVHYHVPRKTTKK